ncbi:hypothetical protein B0H10DRAFT_2217727 [Mycena sp. CBHHK59/15]|nr:hypothetical protein B0H10DRAFT_2217727 [Mycena sp. CBHHK59/15]
MFCHRSVHPSSSSTPISDTGSLLYSPPVPLTTGSRAMTPLVASTGVNFIAYTPPAVLTNRSNTTAAAPKLTKRKATDEGNTDTAKKARKPRNAAGATATLVKAKKPLTPKAGAAATPGAHTKRPATGRKGPQARSDESTAQALANMATARANRGVATTGGITAPGMTEAQRAEEDIIRDVADPYEQFDDYEDQVLRGNIAADISHAGEDLTEEEIHLADRNLLEELS